jgi:raffinose/stachyose/melibiose transport system permease protein
MINRYTIQKNVKGLFLHGFLLTVAVCCVFPLYWMVRSALMTVQTVFVDKSLFPANPHFENFIIAWTEADFGQFFLNSVIYMVFVVGGILFVSSWAAYAFSRLNFPGKNFFFYMFVAAMMIPLPGSFVALYVLMNSLHLINTRIGYVLCMINVGLSLSILILKTFFDKMPADLEDAARIDGCSKMGIWRHVAFPLARPAIAVIVIFNALNVWNEYILAALLLNDKDLMPLQRGLMVYQGAHSVDTHLLMAGLTITVIPILAIYFLMQKHIIEGLSSGAVVG